MRKLRLIQNNEKELLNVNEAAFKLGVAPKTIRKWKAQGKLHSTKIFGAVRFERAYLDALIQEGRSTKEPA